MQLARLAPVIVLLAAVSTPSPAAQAHASGIERAVPFGAVAVRITCTIVPREAQGAWIAAFSVDADDTGLTESSVMILGWWNRGRVATSVRSDVADLRPPVVEVVASGPGYRVSVAAQWGGPHRRWRATLRGGCASDGGDSSDITAVLDGETIGPSASVRLVTAGARAFATSVDALGATALYGSASSSASYLLGVFSARAGALRATAPDGTTTSAQGREPSLGVRGGFGGTWRFDADAAASDDPYLLTALAFG